VTAPLKAIETVYKGYRFRSRLEARWAVFFDTLGLAWEYEPEGFDLDGLWYLPDFRFDEYLSFIEIKGSEPSAREIELASRLAAAEGGLFKEEFRAQGVYILVGSEFPPRKILRFAQDCKPRPSDGFIHWDDDHYLQESDATDCTFAVCPVCGKAGILGWKDHPFYDILKSEGAWRSYFSNRWISNAYFAARTARFEHGQNGMPK